MKDYISVKLDEIQKKRRWLSTDYSLGEGTNLVKDAFHVINVGGFKHLTYTDWYIPNHKSLTFNRSNADFQVNLNKGDYLYVLHKEANPHFNQVGKHAIAVERKQFPVIFEGNQTGNVDIRLSLIFYTNGEKTEVKEILFNHKSFIVVPEGADYMRLAIRIAGQGSFYISNIVVGNIGYWLQNEFNEGNNEQSYYQQYIAITKDNLFDVSKDYQVIYYPQQNILQSKMSGKEFSYLACFENVGLQEAPKETVLHPKPKHYYEFYAGAEVTGDVKLSLLIMEYRYSRRGKIHQVPFHSRKVLQFSEETTHIKILLRVSGSGFALNMYLGFNEHPVQITNEVTFSLHSTDWFGANKAIQMTNHEDDLVAKVDVPQDKKMYVSYKEKNNSFGLLPEHHIISVRPQFIYEFLVRAEMEEGIELLAMLITYSKTEKVSVLNIKLNEPVIVQVPSHVTSFRFAFRIAGAGNFKIREVTIKEMEVVASDSTLHWDSHREPDVLGLVAPKSLEKLRMAVIFDEFTTASYKPECELITFTPDNWLEVLTEKRPDMLMVESAWNGNGGSWNKRVGYYGEENMKPLHDLLQWCNENDIPTVFWNKEDPVHFERFIDTAKRFDHIFTTDENMIPSYCEQAGHDRVYALPFAAQPVIHNPIKIVEERENKACFAGSYYRHHEDRSVDMDRVLDKAAEYGLEIFDRNYEKTKKGLMPNHRFPERFEPYIKGSLKYYEIDKAYKGYKVMINVNTVKYSPTMFSRRVFEGLACGTPVVSTYAQGIEEIFGDLVYISENEADIENAFRLLLRDEQAYRQKALLGIREVLSKHTYAHRLSDIVQKVGLQFKKAMPKVTVLAFAHSKEEFMHALEAFNNQAYENKELYVLIDKFEGYLDLFSQYNHASIKTFIRSYMHNYQNILEWIPTPYVAYFANHDYYGKYYLTDLMLSTTFTNSDFIGKYTYMAMQNGELTEIQAGAEYEFVASMAANRTVAKTDVFSKEPLAELLTSLEQGMDFSHYFKYGKTMYSSDKYNYISGAYHKAGRAQLEAMKDQIEI
jgi:spore maturation protein CgeB